jgi:hypothetical protein
VFSSKYRIHVVLILMALVIIFIPLFNERPEKEKAEAASAAAAEFLQLVDTGKFAESWQNSASLLKEQVSQEAWIEQLHKIRATTGPLVERTQEEMTYSTEAKGSPEGEYIRIVYDTAFEARRDASEILTVMLDEDETWRVAGYFIK